MKTQKLENDGTGYPGSIASMIRLDHQETKAVRKVLYHSKEPLHISAIHKAAGIQPHKLGQVSEFISSYLLNSTREVQMCYDERKRFVGWKLSEHGRDMFQNVG